MQKRTPAILCQWLIHPDNLKPQCSPLITTREVFAHKQRANYIPLQINREWGYRAKPYWYLKLSSAWNHTPRKYSNYHAEGQLAQKSTFLVSFQLRWATALVPFREDSRMSTRHQLSVWPCAYKITTMSCIQHIFSPSGDYNSGKMKVKPLRSSLRLRSTQNWPLKVPEGILSVCLCVCAR